MTRQHWRNPATCTIAGLVPAISSFTEASQRQFHERKEELRFSVKRSDLSRLAMPTLIP
jgi:hypothetical protein